MIEFDAKYYDGLSSRAHDVTVRVDDARLLHLDGLAAPVTHELAAVRISPRLGNTMRSLSLPGGGKCETDDHTALAELDRLTDRGRASALLHGLESSWRAALGAAAVLLALLVVGVTWGVPLLAERLAMSIPPALAYDLGRGTLAMLDSTVLEPSRLPPARRAELEASFSRMARAYSSLPLRLLFRRGMGPNAFALPDGTVVVTDELCELAKNDEEILSVLAHEIGHVHHRHSLRMALESSTVALLVSAYLGDVTQLTTLSAALPGIYAQAHYSRAHETEADTFAMVHMKASGIPLEHFALILRALQRASGKEPESGFQYIASHPPTSERIRRFERPGDTKK